MSRTNDRIDRYQLLGDATENMSASLGETLAGLLNASFGNAVEIIVGIAALMQDQIRIVQTSMLGSILSNLLLVLGCSFLAAGFERLESVFQVTAAQASSSLMTLACIALVIPVAYNSAMSAVKRGPEETAEHGLLVISRGTAILLLFVYLAFLWFQLKSHAFLYQRDREDVENGSPSSAASSQHGSQHEEEEEEEEEPTKNWKKDIKPDDPVFEDARTDDLVIVYCGSEIMEVNHGLESCTRHIGVTTLQLPEDHRVWPNRRLVLVDTPGFNDTDQAEYETFRRISIWLAQSYNIGTKVTGLVYLHAIGQTRMTASALLSYDVFHNICGQNAVSRVVMATSQWDTVALPIGEYRENELRTGWWKKIMDQGAHYQRIEEPLRDIPGIIEHLLEKHAVSIQIQEELVDMDKRVAETEAGKKLTVSLEKMLGSPSAMHLSQGKSQ